MRTILLIVLGCLVGMVGLWLAARMNISRHLALVAFAMIWLGLCGWNMAVGISHGYGVLEELFFLLANFLVPLVIVFALSKKI